MRGSPVIGIFAFFFPFCWPIPVQVQAEAEARHWVAVGAELDEKQGTLVPKEPSYDDAVTDGEDGEWSGDDTVAPDLVPDNEGPPRGGVPDRRFETFDLESPAPGQWGGESERTSTQSPEEDGGGERSEERGKGAGDASGGFEVEKSTN